MVVLCRSIASGPAQLRSSKSFFARCYQAGTEGRISTRFRADCEHSLDFQAVDSWISAQVHKYYIIVILLTGVIPDRAMFRRPVLRQALVPYFQIVQG